MIENTKRGLDMTAQDLGLGFDHMKERCPSQRTGSVKARDTLANRGEPSIGISGCGLRPAPINQSLCSPNRKALVDCDLKKRIRAFRKQFGISNQVKQSRLHGQALSD